MNPHQAASYLDALHGSPLSVISSCLRSMLTAAPGHDLLAADYANIEGRALAWLAGEQWKLDAFRAYDEGTGPDLYMVAAARIDPDKPERQHGKVAELACGYGGGVGAFQQMAKTYLVKVDDALAEIIKNRWREAHPHIVNYWYDLDRAAMEAVLNPGRVVGVRGNGIASRTVLFKVKGSFLWCQVPTGGVICYPYPKVKPRMTPWGEMKDQVHYMTVDGTTNKWVETHTYGGKTAQNITERVCRDQLVYGMRNCEAAGYPIVAHVHDELVAEMPKGKGDLKEFENLCARVHPKMATLPVAVSGWRGERYRKG